MVTWVSFVWQWSFATQVDFHLFLFVFNLLIPSLSGPSQSRSRLQETLNRLNFHPNSFFQLWLPDWITFWSFRTNNDFQKKNIHSKPRKLKNILFKNHAPSQQLSTFIYLFFLQKHLSFHRRKAFAVNPLQTRPSLYHQLSPTLQRTICWKQRGGKKANLIDDDWGNSLSHHNNNIFVIIATRFQLRFNWASSLEQ